MGLNLAGRPFKKYVDDVNNNEANTFFLTKETEIETNRNASYYSTLAVSSYDALPSDALKNGNGIDF